MRSVVYVPWIKLDTVSALSAFCEKASMVSTGWDFTLLYWFSFSFPVSLCHEFIFVLFVPYVWKLMSGLSYCADFVHRIYTPPASCDFSIFLLQKYRDCWVQTKRRGNLKRTFIEWNSRSVFTLSWDVRPYLALWEFMTVLELLLVDRIPHHQTRYK